MKPKNCKYCNNIFQKVTKADRFCSTECQFWSKVDKLNDCWVWKGCLTTTGYGRINIKGINTQKAHRIAYLLTYGKYDEKLCICHKCDNILCVNPNHLFLGTVQDNHKDMMKKNRGSKPPTFTGREWRKRHLYIKLKEEDILYIKNSNEGSKLLAIKFNVSQTYIYHIKKGNRGNSIL